MNIKDATTEQLKIEWDMWYENDGEDIPSENPVFHYEDIHAELNRRGFGEYCCV